MLKCADIGRTPMKIKIVTLCMAPLLITSLSQASGKEVFETYCWGCHHQSAEAFGPSFTQIASTRTAEEIMAMISDPKAVSKLFGYKRNAMPRIELKPDELKEITDYILSYKEKK